MFAMRHPEQLRKLAFIARRRRDDLRDANFHVLHLIALRMQFDLADAFVLGPDVRRHRINDDVGRGERTPGEECRGDDCLSAAQTLLEEPGRHGN